MRTAILLFLPTLLAAQQNFEFTGRYWIPHMNTRIRVESAGLGSDIDARTDLGIRDANFPEAAFTWQHGRSLVAFSYTPIDYSASQDVNRTIIFRGRQYTIGTHVDSDLKLHYLHLAWAYQFVRIRDGIVRFGPMIGADGFLMHGSLAAPSFNISEREDVSIGLPIVGLALDIQPRRWLGIYGQVYGMDIGDYGNFIGSDSGVKVEPVKHLLLTVGYRTFHLHVDDSPDFARLHIRGPFVGAGLRW
ncbi:MAG TPA: hypothetical protein VKE70_37635 [Candidatus Solibacter sp.]|nr:hypothetical protein [Candidatus Solibacter sp.]